MVIVLSKTLAIAKNLSSNLNYCLNWMSLVQIQPDPFILGPVNSFDGGEKDKRLYEMMRALCGQTSIINGKSNKFVAPRMGFPVAMAA